MSACPKVVVTGASGLIGSSLVPALVGEGFEVLRLVRRAPKSAEEVQWDPEGMTIDAEALSGVVGAIHLAGENVAAGRWTESQKARIRDSRVKGTQLIAGTLAQLDPRPSFLVSASAIGYYGNRGAETLEETASAGSGFLASVCVEWEQAAHAAVEAGIRVVHPRIGIVLAREGGALAKMKTPFLLGIGGRLGDGDQYMSWIAHDDMVAGLVFVAKDTGLRGPVNFVAPNPATNAEFTAALAAALNRPAVLPVPKFALRLGMGSQMAEEMLLGGARVVPTILEKAGFQWKYAQLDAALRAVV